jgi:hypothetical protein
MDTDPSLEGEQLRKEQALERYKQLGRYPT